MEEIIKKVIFIDRDGTINIDEKGYISKPEDFNLFPQTIPALKILTKLDYKIFILTNQSGIARGYFTFEDLEKVHNKMLKIFKENKIEIEEILIAPYHKNGKIEPYNIQHEDRKPGLGLFKKALKKHNFSIKNSFMIGDKYSDIEFGKKANLQTIQVLTGNGKNEFLQNREKRELKPNYIAENILAAANLIKDLT